MPIDFQPEVKIDFRPETTIDFQPEKVVKKTPVDFRAEPPKPTGLTHRPFANLRSLLRKPTTTEKKEQIGKVMGRSKWEIGGLQQWTKGYWDAVSKGKIKEFQKLERRLTEEKRNPIDALEKVGWAGLAVNMGMTAGQMLEPAFVSAVAKIRPDLAKPPVPQPSGSVQKVMVALKKVKPLRRVQETIYTKEKGAKLAKSLAVGEKVKGEKGFYAELGELKGEMPKVQFESIRKQVTQADIDDLFIQVKRNPLLNEWDKITARKGLAKLFGEYGGTVPTEGELSLLNRVFGKEFTSTVMAKRVLLLKMKEAGYQLANIPRSIKASFDLSAPFRQGIFFIGRPKQFMRAFFKMFAQFGSDKAFKVAQEGIYRRPTYDLMVKGRLPLTELGKGMATREEAYMGQWAEKLPFPVGRVVRASARAYTGFLNRLRADVFDDLIMKAEKLGLNPRTDMDLTREIGRFVGLGTGRGTLGGLERSAVTLNTFFFSPRLVASRLTLLNPAYYVKASPFVRKEALKSLFSFIGVGLTTLGVAKLGGAEVGTDWRSADFGKIKIGNTRIDIWGGFQQYMVIGARLITGQAVSSTTGKVTTFGKGYKPLTRLDIIQRGIEFKLAPVFSFAKDLLKGQTVAGKPITVSEETKNLFAPMAIEDIYDIMVDDPNLIPVSLLGIFGVGLQTYKGKGTAFSFKGTPKGMGKLRLGGKSSGTGKLSLGK